MIEILQGQEKKRKAVPIASINGINLSVDIRRTAQDASTGDRKT